MKPDTGRAVVQASSLRRPSITGGGDVRMAFTSTGGSGALGAFCALTPEAVSVSRMAAAEVQDERSITCCPIDVSIGKEVGAPLIFSHGTAPWPLCHFRDAGDGVSRMIQWTGACGPARPDYWDPFRRKMFPLNVRSSTSGPPPFSAPVKDRFPSILNCPFSRRP